VVKDMVHRAGLRARILQPAVIRAGDVISQVQGVARAQA